MLNKNNTLIDCIKAHEKLWNDFLKNNFSKNPELIKTSAFDRVYRIKNKIVKIYKFESTLISRGLGLELEFKVLNLLKNTAYDLNPNYVNIENSWAYLEMDFFEGELLELSPWKKKISFKIYLKIIWGLFIMSLKGIQYKQFRGRHIIKNKNEEIKFIDFGESTISSPLKSFYYNFKLFNIQNKKITARSIISILKFNFFEKSKDFDLLNKAKSIFLRNKKKDLTEFPEFLKENPGDYAACRNLKSMELNLEKAIKINKNIYLDISYLILKNYRLFGFKNWDMIWCKVRETTSFKNKIVFEIFCCQATFSSFSVLEGAKRAIASEENYYLIKASKSFSAALGVDNINFIKTNKFKDLKDIYQKEKPNILFACSYRLDNYKVDEILELFSNFEEVFWDTNLENINTKELKSLGFNVIKKLLKSNSQRILVYLSKIK